MMPCNIPEEGIGSQSEEQETPAPVATPQPPPPSVENGKPNLVLVVLAGAGVLLALLVGVYACCLQTMLIKVQKELKQDEFAIQAVAGKAAKAQEMAAASQTNAAGVGDQLNLMDSRVENKFKGYDDYLAKNLPSELKKIPQLEARMIDENKALANQEHADAGQAQDLRQLVETNGARLETAIQIIRTQNDVLKKLLPDPEAKSGSKNSLP